MTEKTSKEICCELWKGKNVKLGFAIVAIISISFALIVNLISGLIWALIGSVVLGIATVIFYEWHIGIISGILACLTVGFLGILQWLF